MRNALASLIEVAIGWPFFGLGTAAIWVANGAAGVAQWLRIKPSTEERQRGKS